MGALGMFAEIKPEWINTNKNCWAHYSGLCNICLLKCGFVWVMLASLLLSAEMNKTNNVIEKINVSLHNKVFSGECQKADENLQELIASLNFRLVCHHSTQSVIVGCSHFFFLPPPHPTPASTQWQLNVLQRRSLVCFCTAVYSCFQYLVVRYL